MLSLFLSLALLVFTLALRLAHKLRLTVPLLYLAAMHTVLRSWYLAHTVLAAYVLYAIVASVALSWLVTLIRAVSDAMADHVAYNAAAFRFAERVRQARANGENVVSAEGLW